MADKVKLALVGCGIMGGEQLKAISQVAAAQVVALVCSQNALVAIAGTMAGLIAAVLASKALASFLYGTAARDPWVLAGSVLALATIASTASLLPALRAARIDPMAAIRCE